jgi:hypothetical protein
MVTGVAGPLAGVGSAGCAQWPLPSIQSHFCPTDGASTQTDRVMVTVHAPGGVCQPRTPPSP